MAEGQGTAAGGAHGAEKLADRAMRERTFDEQPLETKIELLRREARRLTQMVDVQAQLIQRLMTHDHRADGTMLVPIHSLDRNLASAGYGVEAPSGYRYDPLR